MADYTVTTTADQDRVLSADLNRVNTAGGTRLTLSEFVVGQLTDFLTNRVSAVRASLGRDRESRDNDAPQVVKDQVGALLGTASTSRT